MANLHHYYDQLTPNEKKAVDELYRIYHFSAGKDYGIKLAGDDRAEKVVNAMAEHIIESRK